MTENKTLKQSRMFNQYKWYDFLSKVISETKLNVFEQ